METIKFLKSSTSLMQVQSRVVRVYSGPGSEKGFVQQHIFHAVSKDGKAVMDLPAVIICRVDAGCSKVEKLEEYLDEKHASGFFKALMDAAEGRVGR